MDSMWFGLVRILFEAFTSFLCPSATGTGHQSEAHGYYQSLRLMYLNSRYSQRFMKTLKQDNGFRRHGCRWNENQSISWSRWVSRWHSISELRTRYSRKLESFFLPHLQNAKTGYNWPRKSTLTRFLRNNQSSWHEILSRLIPFPPRFR